MIDWLVSLGLGVGLGTSLIHLVNAGLTIAAITSAISTAGVGASLILSLKGILSKKGFEAALR